MEKSKKMEIILLEFLAQYVLRQFWDNIADMAKYKARFHEKQGLEMLRRIREEWEGEEG